MRRELRSPIPFVALATLLMPAAARASRDLVLIPEVPMLLALIVLFVLLIPPTNRLIFKPLFRVLDERESRTAGTRARAARIEEEAKEVLGRYEREVAKTREEAELARRATLESVRNESKDTTHAARTAAEQALERARRELASGLDEARGTLRTRTQDLAREAASRVLGRSL